MTAVRLRPLLAVLILVASFLVVRYWDFVTTPPFAQARYQAVFLANGQTYFGHYLDRLGPYVKLDNAYYLQQTPSGNPDAAPETKLVRRGGELHQPTPEMLIPKSAILFVEDLRADSSVAQFMDKEGGR